MGFAIPSVQLKPIFEALKAKGKVERAFIGVDVKETTYDNNPALIVTAVKGDELIKNKELEVGDIILSYGGKDVSDLYTFKSDISWLEVGGKIHLEVIRDETKKECDVPLLLYQVTKENKNLNKTDEPKGVYYPKLKLGLLNNVVTFVDDASEADLKGVKQGDKIKAVNGHALHSEKDLVLYIKESDDLKKNILLDMEDTRGEPYFVELKFPEMTDRDQN